MPLPKVKVQSLILNWSKLKRPDGEDEPRTQSSDEPAPATVTRSGEEPGASMSAEETPATQSDDEPARWKRN